MRLRVSLMGIASLHPHYALNTGYDLRRQEGKDVNSMKRSTFKRVSPLGLFMLK